jgi:hypothetical protein
MFIIEFFRVRGTDEAHATLAKLMRPWIGLNMTQPIWRT